ncbi:endonuclease/exonuclease/phosphatase family protein [Phaeovulum sp. NW3]|uniref:endonuclease/exonuclease/phosphatase family protein n=1 Tax=Phaeovulum sp. NW3 TaxID=2934933 RepID=UPI00202265D0|nr:endonuclease/exonuclease/phosphatase family protein [Phaeovulum sp. NW3]
MIPHICNMTIRIASYNVHKCVGSDGLRDPHRAVAVINALSADIVALQEVDLRMGHRPAALPPRMIEEETDFEVVPFDRTGPNSLGWHGQTVLARRGLQVSQVHPITLPGLEPRGALALEVSEAGLPPFRLIAAHLGLRRVDRRAQLHRIGEYLVAAAPRPALAIGDFNEWSRKRGFEPLAGFTVHAPAPTFPARAPFGHLDRLVLGPGLQVVRAGVLDTPLSRHASDHLPLWADVAGLRG